MNIASLNPAIRRRVKDKEAELGKKFHSIWAFENPKGEKFLFARYGKWRDDHVIVTIASANPCCIGGWELVY